jgi:hypothetical protein
LPNGRQTQAVIREDVSGWLLSAAEFASGVKARVDHLPFERADNSACSILSVAAALFTIASTIHRMRRLMSLHAEASSTSELLPGAQLRNLTRSNALRRSGNPHVQ